MLQLIRVPEKRLKEKMHKLFKKWKAKWKRHFAHRKHRAGRRKP